VAVRLSVIAPCFNEEANVGALVGRTIAALSMLPVSGELILVDDGSTDSTWRRILEQVAAHAQVVGVRHATNQGIEAAWRTGLERAAGSLICLIDADLQNRPEDIASLYEAYVGGDSALVQAVRHPDEGGRRLLLFSRALNALLNLIFGTRLRDNKSGFILCGRDVLADILHHHHDYRYFQCFVGVVAIARGYRITEVDTLFHSRVAGKSFLSAFPILVSLRILREMLEVRGELRSTRRTEAASTEGVLALDPLAGRDAVEQWNEQFSRENDIDQYYTTSSWPIRWIEGQRLAAIRTLVAPRPEDRLLEVGCGGGHVLKMFPECELTGVDVSGTMLDKARRNLRGCRATLLKGELGEVGLPDRGFDRIICTEVLEHTVDPDDVLAQIRRLTRLGGRVVITLPNDKLIGGIKHVLRWTGLTLTPWFRRIAWGADSYHLHVWSIEEMRTLLVGHFVVVAERFVPGRLLPIRCCFHCEPRPVEEDGPPPSPSVVRRRRILKASAIPRTS
jgi:glycosyltransferase involved in cell wall biosynthesis/SAM-dependent methyltransferase